MGNLEEGSCRAESRTLGRGWGGIGGVGVGDGNVGGSGGGGWEGGVGWGMGGGWLVLVSLRGCDEAGSTSVGKTVD